MFGWGLWIWDVRLRVQRRAVNVVAFFDTRDIDEFRNRVELKLYNPWQTR